MFQLTSHELDSFVKQTGFLRNFLEKMLRLLDILSTLKSNPVTKDAFVLKGGTALNLFILAFPRISADLDLNYVRFISKSGMLRDRKLINSEIQKLFNSEYEIEITKDVHALTQFAFHYQTMSGSSDMVKLEINYLIRNPILAPQPRRFNHFDLNIEFLCLDYQELFASKFVTLLSRYTPRDLFDVYQMVNTPLKIDSNVFRAIFLFYGIVSDINMFDLLKVKFDLITQRDIQNKLAPMLRKGTSLNKNTMVAKIEEFLSPFLVLTGKETIALQKFYNTGELDFDILFPKEEIQEKIHISPSLKWKIQNIKKNL
jgi:hypothetical protein